MQILLLGGTGAIGNGVTRHLAEAGHDIVITTRCQRYSSHENIRYAQGNALDDDFLDQVLKKDWDAVIDFMLYQPSKLKYRIHKLVNSTNHYIFLSSARVYSGTDTPITERTPRLLDDSKDQSFLSSNEYSLIKAKTEDIIFNLSKTNWTILRPYITYNHNRFQLGIMEKESWLNRVLCNRHIHFPLELMDKKTTLTYGDDVGLCISKLIGKQATHSEVFNIASDETLTWSDILSTYVNALESIYNSKIKLSIDEDNRDLHINSVKYQMAYDRLFNRNFDISKLRSVIGDFQFTPFATGIREALSTFSKSPQFNYRNLHQEAYFDKIDGAIFPMRSKAPITISQFMKYLIYRYIYNNTNVL